MAPRGPVVTIGTKAAALSLQAVYDVAKGASVELDPVCLSSWIQPAPKAGAVLDFDFFSVNAGAELAALSDAEARCILVVLLNKLLQSSGRIRLAIPFFLTKVLNRSIEVVFTKSNAGLPDLLSIVRALYEVEAECIGVTKQELEAVEASNAVGVGMAVEAIYCLSPVPTLVDAIAALSCEALRADVHAFDAERFPDNASHRSQADVASALRSLLAGSKLVNPRKGAVCGGFITSVPPVHAAFREALRLFGLNLVVEVNKIVPACEWSSSASFIMEDSAASVVRNLHRIITNCTERVAFCLEILGERQPEMSLHAKTELKQYEDACRDLKSTSVVSGDHVSAIPGLVKSVQVTGKVLALEAGVSLALFASHLDDKPVVERATEDDKKKPQGVAKGSNDKKKRGQELAPGKGTAVLRQVFTTVLQERLRGEVPGDLLAKAAVCADCLAKFFDPQDKEFQDLLMELKAILESNDARRLPKIPKGTRDFDPRQMAIRENAFKIITSVFKLHGAVAIETPVFELRETLMGKYGEDSKLIYDLADQGGEKSSLRYDLTVPFARYIAMNNVPSMKRYHIAKVYRRDNPAKGRYREFYQCDFDIAGQYPLMVPDFEILRVLVELLDKLNIGDYVVKLNHRRLLDAMLDISGVPASKFRSICSAIDKLDKLPWEQVRKEMVEEKGLTGETADEIGVLVQNQGNPQVLLAELNKEGSVFLQHAGAASALDELAVLFKYMKKGKCLHRFVFDLSLARGLDYYTGVIFEAVFKGSVQVGSIAAGGRYDNLVGMFSGKQVPAVGMSLGIERVFAIMEQLEGSQKAVRETQTQVLVIAIGKEMWELAIEIATELWDEGIEAEFISSAPGKVGNHFKRADLEGIPWVVTVGEAEIDRRVVKVKNMQAKEELEVARLEFVEFLQSRISR